MNKERRKTIEELADKLESLKDELDGIASDEREAFEALPEGLQNSERGQASSDAADTLDQASGELDSLIADLRGIE